MKQFFLLVKSGVSAGLFAYNHQYHHNLPNLLTTAERFVHHRASQKLYHVLLERALRRVSKPRIQSTALSSKVNRLASPGKP
ncbi:hypothetical protein PT7_3694 [Pusillimonas sp. T7-7]|nr:hypothetical protein PT7_0517 [Pusillimonas sp. T7-7]AEC22234.1 hypothetical protein PT7_3694 [Pusillimonas sp. T7-7]